MNLPIRLWGDYVLTTAYVINILLTPLLRNKTPYEILFGHPPIYEHMRVFGYLVFVATQYKEHDKFQTRGIPRDFLGYSATQKACKLLDLKTNKLMDSRDVRFEENVFPFHEDNLQAYMESIAVHMAPRTSYDDYFLADKQSAKMPQHNGPLSAQIHDS